MHSPIQYTIYTGTQILQSHINDQKTALSMAFTVKLLLWQIGEGGSYPSED